jgi:hypothetical protein
MQATRTIGCMLTDVTNPLYGKLVFHALEDRLAPRPAYVVLALGAKQLLNSAEARGRDPHHVRPRAAWTA